MFKVTFLSEDGHKFLFESDEKSQEKAVEKGYDKIKELYYDTYGYSLYSVSEDSPL